MSASRCIPAVLAAVVASLLAVPVARAEIWWYIDADGKSHMASHQLDERYQLYFKGDAVRVAPPPAPPAPAVESPDLAALRDSAIYRRIALDPNSERYRTLIEANAQARGLDAALVKAVIAVESAFDPGAVSGKGALGLMQVIPDTGLRYGVAADRKGTVQQKLLDPEINLRIGTTYLSDLLALFANDVDLALAAYNAGENAVLRYAKRVPPYPETQEYVKLVQAFYALYRPPPARPPVLPPQEQAQDMPRFVVPAYRSAF